jgi:chlorite dismutase
MKNDSVETLAQLMDRETDLFSQVLAEESVMTSTIRARDWPQLEESIKKIDEIEKTIQHIETERNEVFLALCREAGLAESASFYHWAVRLPEDRRATLTESYRQLKFKAMEARASGAAISNHLAESKNLLNSLLEELFPQRRGSIYTKNGRSKKAELASVVVNHKF